MYSFFRPLRRSRAYGHPRTSVCTGPHTGLRTRLRTGFRRKIAAAAIFGAVGFTAACGDDSTSPTNVTIKGIILEDTEGKVAYVHNDHWHGSAQIDEGHSKRVHVYYIDFLPEGHDAPPKNTWKLLPNGLDVAGISENATIATWTGTRLEGTIAGKEEGATRINFVVRRSGASTTLYEAPPLNVQVLPHDHEEEH